MELCTDTKKLAEEYRARKRLEKAAPDLLAALEAVVRVYRECGLNSPELIVAEQAIAKAKEGA